MIKIRTFIFTLILLFIQISLFGVKNNDTKDLIFKDGDRVVFIGNSITHGGLYHLYIQTYYQTRFPDRKIEFYNCGIGGDVTTNVLNRMDYDILPHKPTVAVIKLGMNDAGSTFYEQRHTTEELQNEQNRIVAKYTNEMREIIRRLKDNCNPRLFLIKPTPYDPNYKQANRKPLIGKNETIRKLTFAVEKLAKESNATVVDFYNPLNELNINQQLIDSNFTAIGKDRVHPGPMGHLMMAYLFLKSQQVPEIISKVEIDINHKIKSKYVNATVTDLKMDKNEISFELVENAIPFPINQDAATALKYMPVIELNKEILELKGIDKGIYNLKIGDEEVGSFSSDELMTGINLATNAKTPQYKQAQTVFINLKNAFDKRVKLRDLLYAKIMMNKANIDINEQDKFKSFVETKRKENAYYGRTLDIYLQNYNKVDSIETAIKKDLNEARKLSQPVKHFYTLTKK
ncbi:MAG: SGNH/GDSL hydrolase family protein [Paludibacter sp.]